MLSCLVKNCTGKADPCLVSILRVNMDLFASVNESFGDRVGDIVLCSVLARIADTLRLSDHIGLLEGDEFLVVLPNCPAQAALEVAHRILQSLRGTPAANVVKVTASIGVAQWRVDEAVDALLQRAGAALQQAKQNGRDRVELEAPDEISGIAY